MLLSYYLIQKYGKQSNCKLIKALSKDMDRFDEFIKGSKTFTVILKQNKKISDKVTDVVDQSIDIFLNVFKEKKVSEITLDQMVKNSEK